MVVEIVRGVKQNDPMILIAGGRMGDVIRLKELKPERKKMVFSVTLDKRRKCSPPVKVFHAPLREKTIISNQIVDLAAISSEDQVDVLKSTELVSAVWVRLGKSQLLANILLMILRSASWRTSRNSRWNRSSSTPESSELLGSEERRSYSPGCRSLEPLSVHEHSELELEGRIDTDVGEAEYYLDLMNQREA